jgi:hypothetical protein
MNTQHLDRLTAARADLQRMRTALELARQRAADAETARQEAEQKHANTVADALLASDKTPSKPAALSAIQSADDSADAALAVIESRVRSAEGELQNAAHCLVEDSINTLAQSRASESREALKALVAPFEALIAAVGLNGARYAATEMLGRPFKDDSADAITKIVELVPEAQHIRQAWDIRCAEVHVLPSPDEIATLVDEARKETEIKELL